MIIPNTVYDELTHRDAPEFVREWVEAKPTWLQVRAAPGAPIGDDLDNLDEGERAALVLAASLSADLLLLDD